jgi:hypothetical protein
MVDLRCGLWHSHRLSEPDAADDALSASCTRAEPCLLHDCEDAVGQSCSHIPL